VPFTDVDYLRQIELLADVAATEGLLRNWEIGRAVWPGEPLDAQVARVVDGWIRPMILHPRYAAKARGQSSAA
jgi:hypothetical protein